MHMLPGATVSLFLLHALAAIIEPYVGGALEYNVFLRQHLKQFTSRQAAI
jgi:hypothetical protein